MIALRAKLGLYGGERLRILVSEPSAQVGYVPAVLLQGQLSHPAAHSERGPTSRPRPAAATDAVHCDTGTTA